jgi:hypothetical protein
MDRPVDPWSPKTPAAAHCRNQRLISPSLDLDEFRRLGRIYLLATGSLSRRRGVLHDHKSLGYFAKYAWRNSSITGGGVS